MILYKTPFRIPLAGGGTDIDFYYKKDYYKCFQDKADITKAFQSLFNSDVQTQSENNIKRSADPTGNSYW